MTREEWVTLAVKDFIINFPEKGVTIICHEEDPGKGEDRRLICVTSGARLERRQIDFLRILKESPESRQIIDSETDEIIKEETGRNHLSKRRLDS